MPDRAAATPPLVLDGHKAEMLPSGSFSRATVEKGGGGLLRERDLD